MESQFVAQGVPAALAHNISLTPILPTALDLTRLSTKSMCSIDSVAETYFGLGQRLGFSWMVEHARGIVAQTPWQREAVEAILGDLSSIHRHLTALIIGKAKDKKTKDSSQKMADWLAANTNFIERYDAMMNEWRSTGAVDIAMLALASRQLNTLLS
jgi:glutamate dehydrogenase